MVLVGVIPLMPNYKTNLECLDLVSMTLGTDSLDNTFPTNCCSPRHALEVVWLESTIGRSEVPSSLLMVPFNSDSRRRASSLGLPPLRPVTLRRRWLELAESDVTDPRWIRVGFGSASSC